jgi:Leucine-rich repeat (LRR) protein
MLINYWFNNEEHTCERFEELIKLDNYNDIKRIQCYYNELTMLPKLPNSLRILNCGKNKLTLLPELPNSLTHLDCYYNELTMLPKLPNSLRILNCNFNRLTTLPILPNSLRILNCDNNMLTMLPKLPDCLRHLNCGTNPVYDFIEYEYDGNLGLYYKVKQLFANKIGEWFLECKYNPTYKYCRDRVDKEYDKLF